MASDKKQTDKQQSSNNSLEEKLKVLEDQNSKLQKMLTELQDELYEIRSRSSKELAIAQDRLYWMDNNYLGPEVVARRPYLKFFVRILNFGRYVAARFRNLRARFKRR